MSMTKAFMAKIAHKGGNATKAKYGKAHFSKIAKKMHKKRKAAKSG